MNPNWKQKSLSLAQHSRCRMQDAGFQPKTNGANFNVNIHLRGQPRLTPAKKLRPLGFSRKVQKTKQITIINSTIRHNQSYRSRFTECQEHIVHPVQSLAEIYIQQHVQLFAQSLKPHSPCFSCFRGRGLASVPHTGEPKCSAQVAFSLLTTRSPMGWMGSS